ncbi:hypothetical protein OBBRIDRAFT_808528 [Obba rivulosa]|uniref:Uncharacterized protein n=1 Tax=Obba rivulosa TaxID=1052685 RepID=A0A8E2AH32_9APHY|nr:hypothetical protein OBBRIDRAFT_808528 [Obba rivulosa]
MSEFHTHEVYAEQLGQLGLGVLLWLPDPIPGVGEVEIRDVRCIFEGAFWLSRSVLANASPQPHDGRAAEPRGPLGDKGALLVLQDPATQKLLNIDSWCHFAASLGITLQRDEIIFVSGWVKTTACTRAAFAQSERSGSLTSNINTPFPARASLYISVSRNETVTQPHRSGAYPQNPMGAALNADQCIFIRYYKLNSCSYLSSSLKASAESPDLDEFPDEPRSAVSVISEQPDLLDTEIVEVSSQSKECC